MRLSEHFLLADLVKTSTGLPNAPSAEAVENLQLVLQALSEADGDLAAAETAEAAGISRVSARRYLEHLVNAGRAEVRLRYGEVGRPERRYRAGPSRR